MERLFLTSVGIKPEIETTLIDIIGTSRKQRTVAYIPTVEKGGQHSFVPNQTYRWLETNGFKIEPVPLDPSRPAEAIYRIQDADIIVMPGGHTFRLRWLLGETGVDRMIVGKIREGYPFIGSSAAAMIVGPTIEPALYYPAGDRNIPESNNYTGLGLIRDIVWPHYQDGHYPKIKKLSRRFHHPFKMIGDHQAIAYIDGNGEIFGVTESVLTGKTASPDKPLFVHTKLHRDVKQALTHLLPQMSRITDPHQKEAVLILQWVARTLKQPANPLQAQDAISQATAQLEILKDSLPAIKQAV